MSRGLISRLTKSFLSPGVSGPEDHHERDRERGQQPGHDQEHVGPVLCLVTAEKRPDRPEDVREQEGQRVVEPWPVDVVGAHLEPLRVNVHVAAGAGSRRLAVALSPPVGLLAHGPSPLPAGGQRPAIPSGLTSPRRALGELASRDGPIRLTTRAASSATRLAAGSGRADHRCGHNVDLQCADSPRTPTSASSGVVLGGRFAGTGWRWRMTHLPVQMDWCNKATTRW
jgi:hypothetical protein